MLTIRIIDIDDLPIDIAAHLVSLPAVGAKLVLDSDVLPCSNEVLAGKKKNFTIGGYILFIERGRTTLDKLKTIL